MHRIKYPAILFIINLNSPVGRIDRSNLKTTLASSKQNDKQENLNAKTTCYWQKLLNFFQALLVP